MSRTQLTLLILVSLVSVPTFAHTQTTWYVDDDCIAPGSGTELDPFCTIQGGVNASSDGDTVLVAQGTYTGDGDRDISLFGKLITLKSTDGPALTIIDIQGSPDSIHRGFFLIHGEPNETVIEGFSVVNGYLIGDTGGSGAAGGGGGAGIYIRDSGPTIRNCIVRNNFSATLGVALLVDGRAGGVYIDGNSNAIVEKCLIIQNIGEKRGGGMYIGYAASEVVIRDSLIASNTGGGGGGIYNTFGNTEITNTTIVNNAAGTGGGGGLVSENSDAFLSNCILWGNMAREGSEISFSCGLVPTIEYGLVQGVPDSIKSFCDSRIDWGPGMIDADPLFFDPEKGDFRLSAGSPCIDAGNNLAVPEGAETDLNGGPRFLDDPSTPDTGNPDPDEPRLPIVDMGPYEFDPDDCNNNGVLDEEDIKSGASSDIDENGIPDECQPDCNNNDIPDSYEISEGMSEDCDANGVPDECEPDCNENAQADACDIADGISHDCNDNGVPDECPQELPGPPITQQPVSQEVEVGELAFFQVQADGVVLEYQWRKDAVDLIDTERILGSQTPLLLILDVVPEDAGEYDCVVTELFDLSCATSDPATLTVTDPCPADINDDGVVGPVDLAMLLGAWGPCADPDACPADLNGNGSVGPFDLATLLGAWGPCP